MRRNFLAKLPKLILITGRKFNGKDTVANYLHNKYEYTQLAFAEPLKHICKILFGFTNEQLYGSTKETLDERWKITPRRVLQYMGTEMFRKGLKDLLPDIGENIWIKCMEYKLADMFDSQKRIIISDARFPNEMNLAKTFSRTLKIRVTRPYANTSKDVHASEIEIEHLDVDVEILNDGTLEDLYENIDEILKEYGKIK